MKIAVIIGSLVFICFPLYAQKYSTTKRYSPYTYIYAINDNTAKILFTKPEKFNVDHANVNWNNPIDSFPRHSTYDCKLGFGNYIKVNVREELLEIEAFKVANAFLGIKNNSRDLCIELIDLNLEPITNAEVKINSRRVHFDKKVNLYRIPKSNNHGILAVKWNNFTQYFSLERERNNSRVARITKKIVFAMPLRFVTVPLYQLVKLPYYAAWQWVDYDYPYYSNPSARYFKNIYYRLIDNDKYYRKNQLKYFVLTNKPIYRLGDTVKMKFFAFAKNNKPLNDSLTVFLNTYTRKRNAIKLSRIGNYNPGLYVYQFILHDSLEIKSNSNCNISFVSDKGKSISHSIEIEDYELRNTKLQVRIGDKIHKPGVPFEVFAKAIDQNGLNIPDATLDYLLLPGRVHEFNKNVVLFKDTLLAGKITLKSYGETSLIIPDSIFESSRMEYKLICKMQTSDNEMRTEMFDIKYLDLESKFDYKFDYDTLKITLNPKNDSLLQPALIEAYDSFDNLIFTKPIELPARLKVHPFISSFTLKSGNLRKEIEVNMDAGLFCYGDRKNGMIDINVINPLGIKFTYYIFKNQRIIERGFGDKLNFKHKDKSKKPYFVSIQYIWGGKTKTMDLSFPNEKSSVQLEVKHPELIVPGQNVNFEIKVIDGKGHPISNADVTALGYTSKFKESLPEMPKLIDEKAIYRFGFNSFEINNDASQENSYPTDSIVQNWINPHSLDSLLFYKNLLTDNKIFTYTEALVGKKTQFAPFVTSNGKYEPIYAIYVNNVPVYLGGQFVANEPYSFQVSSLKCNIKLRLYCKEIEIKEFTFLEGNKTYLTISDNCTLPFVSIKDKKCGEFDESEKSFISKFIMPVNDKQSDEPFFIKQHYKIFKIEGNTNYSKTNPTFLFPIFKENFTYFLFDTLVQNCLFEPNFEYFLSKNLIKMKEFKTEQYFSSFKNFKDVRFNEFVLEGEEIAKQWENLKLKIIAKKRYLLGSFSINNNGPCKLILNSNFKDVESGQNPEFHVLFCKSKPAFYSVVFSGETKNLSEGWYEMVSVFEGCKYLKTDSIELKKGYTTYALNVSKRLLEPDSTIHKLCDALYNQVSTSYNVKKDYYEVQRANEPIKQHPNGTTWVKGRVVDKNTGDGIPFAIIYIKNTNYGTTSDLNGDFRLNMPNENSEIVCSFIGYEQTQISLSAYNPLVIELKPSMCELEAVVVTAMGISLIEKNSANSVVSSDNINTMYIDGIRVRGSSSIPESSLNILTSKVAGINGSEKNPNLVAESGKLIIVDGAVFLGKWSDFDKTTIHSIEELSVSEAITKYGNIGNNGAMLVTTVEGYSRLSKGALYDENFFEQAKNAKSLRTNFRDDAFWQPKLRTNDCGVVKFNAVFPDDITAWKTGFYVLSPNRKTAMYEGEVKSYKPVLSQLSIPRFAVEGDSIAALGKLINYGGKAIVGSTQFSIENNKSFTHQINCNDYFIDTLMLVVPNQDSVRLTYIYTDTTKYSDGEKRVLPINKQGAVLTKGWFGALKNDSIFTLPTFADSPDSLFVRIDLHELDLISLEAKRVVSYMYNCNEQMASKLKALLILKKLSEYQNMPFEKEKDITKLIKQLTENQNSDGLWSWWGRANTEFWISNHVLEALICAQKAGYTVSYNRSKIIQYLVLNLTKSKIENWTSLAKIAILFKEEIELDRIWSMINYNNSGNKQSVFILELKQLLGMPINVDSIVNKLSSTLYENLYCPVGIDENFFQKVHENSTMASLAAYRIIRNSGTHLDVLPRIKNYFLEIKKEGSWLNTFESISIMETILPELISKEWSNTTVLLSGSKEKIIDHFPAVFKVPSNSKLYICKKGLEPVYVSAYFEYYDKAPKTKADIFDVIVSFPRNKENRLKVGQIVDCEVTLKVKYKADYVMIEIPIPAGCSYASSESKSIYETHREYFKDRVNIYVNSMEKGTYVYKFSLITRYSGTYTMNPTIVLPMYMPTKSGNNTIQQVRIVK